MKIRKIIIYVLAVSVLLTSLLGCAKKQDISQDETEEPAESSNSVIETPSDFNHVLSAWDAGSKEEATKQFIQINWDKPEVFANVPVLNISEQDYMTSSQDQQKQILRNSTEFATKLRKLGLHILSAGETSLASGDKEASKTHYEAVLKCARSIASKDCLESIRLTARGFIKAAEDKLLTVELGKDYEKGLQNQVNEVRRTFLSLQQVCKANDIDKYLDFWDDETFMALDGRDRDLDERRERRRKSLTRRPGTLQDIANARIESITVDYWEAEKLEILFGVEIKGTMMLVRTNVRALLFHETAKGWKLFTLASPEHFP